MSFNFVCDWRDTHISSYYYTVEDFNPPNWTNKQFYFGVAYVQGVNPPYSDSYGYQMGFVSSQSPLSNTNWAVALTNPGFSNTSQNGETTNFYVQHAKTIGAQNEGCGGPTCTTGDAYWHDNWAYGCGSLTCQPWGDKLSPVESAAVDQLSASQVNGQIFTAGIGQSSPEAVQVTDFAGIKSSADRAGEGGWNIGTWIWAHPWANGLYWTVLGTNTVTPSLTWTYSNGYLVADNTQLW